MRKQPINKRRIGYTGGDQTIEKRIGRSKKGKSILKKSRRILRKATLLDQYQLWCTDFTYLYLKEGEKRYNCSVIDLYDKSVVATKNSSRIDTRLAVDTLKLELERNNIKEGLILHSDQGSQYTSRVFTEYCERNGIIQSMSRAGCPYDNAPMESFYGTLKAELIRQKKFTDDELLDEAVAEYSYVWYKGERKSGFLGALH